MSLPPTPLSHTAAMAPALESTRRELLAHRKAVLCLAWSASGRKLASGGADECAHVERRGERERKARARRPDAQPQRRGSHECGVAPQARRPARDAHGPPPAVGWRGGAARGGVAAAVGRGEGRGCWVLRRAGRRRPAAPALAPAPPPMPPCLPPGRLFDTHAASKPTQAVSIQHGMQMAWHPDGNTVAVSSYREVRRRVVAVEARGGGGQRGAPRRAPVVAAHARRGCGAPGQRPAAR
jgi:hypothetical protein